ncbi:MAG: M14 family metallopeptidase [Bacteroidota bacterium]
MRTLRVGLLLTLASSMWAACASSSSGKARLSAADLPVTRAEATGYSGTSSYVEVMAFVGALADIDATVRTTSFGTTNEGRELPLLVWGAPSAEPEAIRATGKTRVLVFANIHAGEVAGKEAALMVAREMAQGLHEAWTDSLVVLIAPIYNADGNERVEYGNRPRQFGPVDGMGQRPNAQGLDLNRDFMKLRAPESRGLVGLIRDADPHIVVDLHTTNGTFMGYHLTYAPGLSPNTPSAISEHLYDRWLPDISETIIASDDYATYHYGNVPGTFGEGTSAPRGWYTFSAQPRFSTNYIGLRNRYGILSEAYSYATFEDRVLVTKRFVEEILDQAWADASEVRRIVEAADAESVVGRELAVRASFAPLDQPAEILLGAVDTVYHPLTDDRMYAMRDVRTPETMPAFVRFEPSERVRAPQAYLLSTATPGARVVRDLLISHGVQFDTTFAWGTERERFVVDSVRVARREFQQVRQLEPFGRWTRVPAETGQRPRLAPSLRIPVNQPLGRVIVALMEPRSDDSVIAWTLLPLSDIKPGNHLPIERIP